MGVPAHNHLKSCRFRLQIQLVQIVKNVDRDAGDFEHIRGWNLPRPGVAIDIATNRCNGSNLSQRLQNGGIADVAGMNDVVRAAQRGESLGTKQAVSIGDDADDLRVLRTLNSQVLVWGGHSCPPPLKLMV